jgi:branched-chain amino acid transport system substrate-binding protein
VRFDLFASTTFTIFLCASISSAEVLVGIAVPLSGPALPTGEQVEVGALKAIDDLNANGGVLGQLIVASSVDDACDAGQAAAAARQLVAEGVQFVIGHACSSGSIAGGPIYAEGDIIMMSPASTNPRVTDSGLDNVFRVIGRDDEQGAIAGDFLADAFGDKNIAILHDQSAYGQGLAEITKMRLNERGVTETLFEIYVPDQTAYPDLIQMMSDAEIDVVYVGGYQADAGIIIREAKSRLPAIQLVSGDALASEDFPFIAGDAGIGSYFTFGPDARTTPAAVSVVASFRDDEGFEPSGYTLYSYATVQVWAQAVEKAGTFDIGPVAQTLRGNDFDTVLGTLGFDSKGDVTGLKSFVWYQIRENSYSPVE